MTTATYEMYEAFEEEAEQGCESFRAPQLRDKTSKQKYCTRARYSRRSSSSTGAIGAHRRRHKSCR